MIRLLAAMSILAAPTAAAPNIMHLLGTGEVAMAYNPSAPRVLDPAVDLTIAASNTCPPYAYISSQDYCEECEITVTIWLPMTGYDCGGCGATIFTKLECEDPNDTETRVVSIPGSAQCEQNFSRDYDCPDDPSYSVRLLFGCTVCD